MDFLNLTSENVLLYAMRNYENPSAHGMKEFQEDYSKFKYVKRLLKRYREKGLIKERLTLNHITILYNVFGPAATRILFYKMESDLYPILKTFLVALNMLPDVVKGIDGKDIRASEIMPDAHLIQRLREARMNTI